MTVSNRYVSKGSSRGSGPQTKHGTVNVRATSGIDWERQQPACPCGRRMSACKVCGEFSCTAPGHLKHVCADAKERP